MAGAVVSIGPGPLLSAKKAVFLGQSSPLGAALYWPSTPKPGAPTPAGSRAALELALTSGQVKVSSKAALDPAGVGAPGFGVLGQCRGDWGR